MFKVSIPEISDEELLKRYQQIKPVMSDSSGALWWVKEYSQVSELRYQSYRFAGFAEVIRNPVGVDELTPLMGEDFACLHRYGYYGLFKPSIAEVLAQIDDRLIGNPDDSLVTAFEIIDTPKDWDDMVGTPLREAVFNQGYHISTVRLYARTPSGTIG